MTSSNIQPALLRKMTVRRVLECLQLHGPLSRADLTRETGISAPTVSKAVVDLLESGLLEEGEAPGNALGRPGKRLQLAKDSACVIGVVFDVRRCEVVTASLDGQIDESRTIVFATPSDYDCLLEEVTVAIKDLQNGQQAALLGIGISTPGLVDEQQNMCLLSPNLPMTNLRKPAEDVSRQIKVTATCVQESKALCLGERFYGKAAGVDHFAVVDMTSGLGLGVFDGGELFRGCRGLAGELGHITIDPDGEPCGCGNRGCLETMATDAALVRLVRKSYPYPDVTSIEDVLDGIRSGQLDVQTELDAVCEYQSIAVAATINLLNPSALFIHGQLLKSYPERLETLRQKVGQRTLNPSYQACDIQLADGSKQRGVVASIVHHLTQATGPRLTD